MLNQKKAEIFLAKFHKSLAKQFLEVAYRKIAVNWRMPIHCYFVLIFKKKRNAYSCSQPTILSFQNYHTLYPKVPYFHPETTALLMDKLRSFFVKTSWGKLWYYSGKITLFCSINMLYWIKKYDFYPIQQLKWIKFNRFRIVILYIEVALSICFFWISVYKNIVIKAGRYIVSESHCKSFVYTK